MKYYTLEATVNRKSIKFDKKFNSRKDAIDYMFKYLEKNYIYNFNINESYNVSNKHEVEYVSDFNNRFLINRVTL